MASRDVYETVLRVKLRTIIEELPDTNDLLKDPRISRIFSDNEKAEISRQPVISDRIVKFVDIIKCKGPEAYDTLVATLRDYRPSLADKLQYESMQQNRRLQDREDQNVTEEAGIFCLSACGPGPTNHISHISESGRQLLGNHLNRPRNLFCSFCTAMNVEQEMMHRAQRSGNPTAYLLQEMNNDPNATMDRLSSALNSIGKPELYEFINCDHLR